MRAELCVRLDSCSPGAACDDPGKTIDRRHVAAEVLVAKISEVMVVPGLRLQLSVPGTWPACGGRAGCGFDIAKQTSLYSLGCPQAARMHCAGPAEGAATALAGRPAAAGRRGGFCGAAIACHAAGAARCCLWLAARRRAPHVWRRRRRVWRRQHGRLWRWRRGFWRQCGRIWRWQCSGLRWRRRGVWGGRQRLWRCETLRSWKALDGKLMVMGKADIVLPASRALNLSPLAVFAQLLLFGNASHLECLCAGAASNRVPWPSGQGGGTLGAPSPMNSPPAAPFGQSPASAFPVVATPFGSTPFGQV